MSQPVVNYSPVGNITGGNQIPIQYPYSGNNLIMNTPYDNYMGRQSMQQNLPFQYLKCRPVASKEEARACQIDLDGSLWVFTDVGNNKIYTKQINNDGTATFKTYVFTEEKENQYNSSEYVTKEELNQVVQNLMATFNNSSIPNENKDLSF